VTVVDVPSSSTFDGSPSPACTTIGTDQELPSAGVGAPASDAVEKRKRCWVRVTSSPRADTPTSGYPPWKIQVSMMRRTGSPVASSMASHRSVVSALP
jgi:hypothetical protein